MTDNPATRRLLGAAGALALAAGLSACDDGDAAPAADEVPAASPALDETLCDRVPDRQLAEWAGERVAERHPEVVDGFVNCDATLASGTGLGWQVRRADRTPADLIAMYRTGSGEPEPITLDDGTGALALRSRDGFDREQVAVACETADGHLVVVLVTAAEGGASFDAPAAEELATGIAETYAPGLA